MNILWRCSELQPPLFEKIRELRDEGRDFAYICRFADLEREHGVESLFQTDEKPLLVRDNPKEALNRQIPEMLDGMEKPDKAMVPLFLSYELIESIYGIKLKNRSDWPLVAAINPTSYDEAGFTRASPGFTRLKTDVSRISSESRGILEGNIQEIVNRIQDGEMLQTVLSHRFEVKQFDAFELTKYMMLQDRSRYVYYYRFGELEIVGSSPESVFVRQGRNITIHPIAGTRRRADGPDSVLINDLLNDRKELCEHRMLVDLARNDLSRVCEPGSVKVRANMTPEKFYSVIHLTSVVDGILRPGVTPFDLISSVFPAGTVSGELKSRAMEFIDRYDNTGRGVYCGTAGDIVKVMDDITIPIGTV